MSTPSPDVREVQLSEIPEGHPVTVDEVRTVFLATYSARLHDDPQVVRLLDGDRAFSINKYWFIDVRICIWFLERLPTLSRPQTVTGILMLLHDLLEDPVDKALREKMRSQGKEKPWTATDQG